MIATARESLTKLHAGNQTATERALKYPPRFSFACGSSKGLRLAQTTCDDGVRHRSIQMMSGPAGRADSGRGWSLAKPSRVKLAWLKARAGC